MWSKGKISLAFFRLTFFQDSRFVIFSRFAFFQDLHFFRICIFKICVVRKNTEVNVISAASVKIAT